MKSYILNVLLIISPFLQLNTQNPPPFDEQLINSTIKIESIEKLIENGKVVYKKSSGTGFFFAFRKTKDIAIPVIVTNKHVIKNSYRGVLYFKVSDSAGNPIYGKTEKVTIGDFSKRWIYHPDSTVDLAICLLMPIINEIKKSRGKNLFFITLPEEIIISDSLRGTLNAIEDITMIGYPYGLRDTINDLPVVRRGISATPIYLEYNSKKEFLIDMPVFFGSSGSPILIYNQGSWSSRGYTLFTNQNRVLLAGINYATYTRDFDGKILPITSDNLEDSFRVKTNIPLYNIGVIIKAERLLEFKPLLNIK